MNDLNGRRELGELLVACRRAQREYSKMWKLKKRLCDKLLRERVLELVDEQIYVSAGNWVREPCKLIAVRRTKAVILCGGREWCVSLDRLLDKPNSDGIKQLIDDQLRKLMAEAATEALREA